MPKHRMELVVLRGESTGTRFTIRDGDVHDVVGKRGRFRPLFWCSVALPWELGIAIQRSAVST